jgi:hypothetical protein
LKKLLILLFGIYAIFYLTQKDILPSLDEVRNIIQNSPSQQMGQETQKTVSSEKGNPPQQSKNLTSSEPASETSTPAISEAKYPPIQIQTYWIGVNNGKIVVSGKPTAYGKYSKANGIILYIQEPRADKKVTLKVPFKNGKVNYEYPLDYTVGDVIVNLDEYKNGVENDPNKVLGYGQFQLTDGDPYLLPSYMIQSNHPTIVALAQNITSGKRTETEKSRAIFEWVAKNIAYNAPLINSPNPPLYSALQTYQNRVVLCSGYADLSAAIHRASGIEAKVVYGDNHAWNEIMLNGVWQTEDPTYGSGFINANTNVFVRSYQPAYFYKSDAHKEGEYPW